MYAHEDAQKLRASLGLPVGTEDRGYAINELAETVQALYDRLLALEERENERA